MRVSYNWLRDFAAFPHSPQELGTLFDQLGHAVESLDEIGARWRSLRTGKVITCEKVPGSDHLSWCMVDAGAGELLGVVCGAPNVAAGQIVAVALVGAVLPGGFCIEERKLRGLLSRGMICSEKELGLSEEKSGILVLPEDIPIGRPLEKFIGKPDWVFDLEITINRGDCLSHLGLAREIAAKTGLKLKLPDMSFVETDEPTSEYIVVEIQAPDRCPRYSARLVKDVTIKPSPLWMQERLRAVGIRAISNVVDVTNYILMELGHPLHAFDYHLVKDGHIIVRTAQPGESFTTLDKKVHQLADTDLLIADPEKGIALAGVMGGLNTEIRDDTRDVLLECAYFDPVSIRITSRDHGISSESARRFERGVDPELTIVAVNRAAALINQLAGGGVCQGIVDNYPRPWRPAAISLRPTRVNGLLDTDISGTRMAEYFSALGCQVEPGDVLQVTPPSWRHDLEREIDLVEEAARLYGYDLIGEAEVSRLPLTVDPESERERRRTDRIKWALIELGLFEAISPTLISLTDIRALGRDEVLVKILNPLSEDMGWLRPNLASSLLRAAARNLNAGVKDARLFEWGKCFRLEGEKVAEEWRLGAVLVGRIRPESWNDSTRPLDIYDLKGILQSFLERLAIDITPLFYYDIIAPLAIGGIIAEVDPGNRVGWFGQIDPKIAGMFAIDVPVWYFELSGDWLLHRVGAPAQYQPLPRYPAALRDLAFLVDDTARSVEIEGALRDSGGELLQTVELCDQFKGTSLPPGKKSLCYHLTFRSSTRTLEDGEVDQLVQTMVTETQRQTNAQLRTI
ncbi:MAG: phenylalanine--tRNA ligase subunit beta [Calditrichota bacterium]